MVKVKLTKKRAAKLRAVRETVPAQGTVSSVVVAQPMQVVPKPKKTPKVKKPKSRSIHHKILCSITDPFCVHARGAKLPDESTVPSFPWQFKTLFAVGVGGAGQANFIILANNYLGYHTAATTPSASGAITFANFTAWTGASTATANFQSGRIVSMGTTIYPTVSMSSAQGYLILKEIPSFTSGTTFTNGSTETPNCRVVPVVPGRPISFIHRPQGPQSRLFNTFDSGSIDQEGFSSLHAELIGGPTSGSPLLVEVTVNLEVIPKQDNTVVSKLATPAAPHNPKVMAAQNAVMTKVGGFVEGAKETVGAYLANAATSALESFGEMAFGLL